MTTSNTNELVAAYLRRLEQAANSLPRSRRTELVAEIREHIDDALLEAGAADEVAVRNVLERLGPPEEIAAAAGPPAVGPTGHAGKFEIAALVALALPFVGWLVGIPLVLVSKAWSGREKAIGVLLGLIPFFAGFLLFGIGADSAGGGPPGTPDERGVDGLGPLEVSVLIGALLGGLVASSYLGLRLRRRPEPSELASA
jgi:hypothetical protein